MVPRLREDDGGGVQQDQPPLPALERMMQRCVHSVAGLREKGAAAMAFAHLRPERESAMCSTDQLSGFGH